MYLCLCLIQLLSNLHCEIASMSTNVLVVISAISDIYVTTARVQPTTFLIDCLCMNDWVFVYELNGCLFKSCHSTSKSWLGKSCVSCQHFQINKFNWCESFPLKICSLFFSAVDLHALPPFNLVLIAGKRHMHTNSFINLSNKGFQSSCFHWFMTSFQICGFGFNLGLIVIGTISKYRNRQSFHWEIGHSNIRRP